MELDLSSLQSIKDFVKRFREEYTHLNYLVHCDGVVFVGFGECITLKQVTLSSISCPSAEQTVDGFERHFQVVLHVLKFLEFSIVFLCILTFSMKRQT